MSESNICKCPDPPGGEVRCEPDQIAICRVRDGKRQSRCLSVPQVSRDGPRPLLNWTIAEIRNERRSPEDAIEIVDLELLRSGTLSTKEMEVTFSLPGDIREVLDKVFEELVAASS